MGPRVTAVLLLIIGLPCLAAEEDDVSGDDPIPVHEHGREWFPMGGIKYDSVTGLTGAGCVLIHIADPFAKPNELGLYTCSHSFLVAQIEAGEGGGKLQFGIGAWYMVGWAAKASVLRTWHDPMELERDQTYLGAEIQLNFFLLNSTVGLYAEVDGDGEDETIVTWSAGIGF